MSRQTMSQTVGHASPVIRRRDLVAAEVTKILTHPATLIAAGITLLLNTALGVVHAADLVRLGIGGRLVPLSELGTVVFAPIYVFLVLPVYAAGSEYQSGQIRLTLAAVPDRVALALAKLAALLTVTVPAALIVLAPARLSITIADGTDAAGIVLDLGRWLVAYTLMAIVAYGLAGLLRSTITPLAILVLIPVLIATGVFQVPEIIRLLPDQLSLSLLGTPAYAVTELPPAEAGAALTVWALLLAVAYSLALARRDS
ncbi:ABC transporter [Nonomuraea sp. NPDC049309]|uniref:ABC transporter n=1 Tax=Nonomuraea sp. NPDC049309 TaxID=3364350 RepID=UPI003712160E